MRMGCRGSEVQILSLRTVSNLMPKPARSALLGLVLNSWTGSATNGSAAEFEDKFTTEPVMRLDLVSAKPEQV